MKIIGLIGGMSWESSLEYYRVINQEVKKRLGGLHSGKIILYSVDFSEIEKYQHEGNWLKATEVLVNAAKSLEIAGADCVVICTNTMHKMAPDITKSVKIPLLHIADATGQLIQKQGIKKIGLLGTKYTMEHDFYKGRLIDKYGLEVITPQEEERQVIHDIIYNELCLGNIQESSRKAYLGIIDTLQARGAEGVILGCTEIGLLVKQMDTTIALFDTTHIHALSAVDYSLN